MGLVIQILFLFGSLLLASHAFSASSVYEISKGKNKLYLAGTIHLLRKQDFPLPLEFDAVYKQAQKIYFETNIQKAKSVEFGQRFSQAMILSNNITLKDVLSESVWSKLQAYATENQYPLNQTMMFNAAMVSTLITVIESKKMGVVEGIDVYYDKQARSDNKVIGQLETSDDVIAYMQKISQTDPNRIIENTLSDVKKMSIELGEIIEAWKQGDLNFLDKNMGDKMRQELPSVYQSLVVERNQKWLPQIEAMLKTPAVEMVLVGSLHLSGDDGLLVQLKKAGYHVKPYQLH